MCGHIIFYICTSQNQTLDHKMKLAVILVTADDHFNLPQECTYVYIWFCFIIAEVRYRVQHVWER